MIHGTVDRRPIICSALWMEWKALTFVADSPNTGLVNVWYIGA